ncbi:MAG: hypothetical protein QW775_02910 [Ignisphaera sp.]|uniref:Uncharacterized protein n=1 Tax=Ignisphaera aggregans TaxID=334771 RepID=A0A7C4JJI1_9CREN
MKHVILKGISNVFRNSIFTVTKHRLALSSVEEDMEKDELTKLRVIPLEALSAIHKMMQGDIKSFAESHIESHVCTNLTALCRDYPYRVKYSIYNDGHVISMYSECIDLEILLTIVFGDIIKYFEFIEGFRDNVLFKYVVIPRSVLGGKLYNTLNYIAGHSSIRITSKQIDDIFSRIVQSRDDVSEMIFVIPCIDLSVIDIMSYLFKELLKNPIARIFIVTSSPSIYDAKTCRLSYREFFVNYIELLDLVRMIDRVYLCDSEVNNFEIILNRATYLISYEPKLALSTQFIPIKDYSYTESYALKYLRDCLCSSHLVKD